MILSKKQSRKVDRTRPVENLFQYNGFYIPLRVDADPDRVAKESAVRYHQALEVVPELVNREVHRKCTQKRRKSVASACVEPESRNQRVAIISSTLHRTPEYGPVPLTTYWLLDIPHWALDEL